MEVAIFRAVRRLEEEGYDAVVVGCCYDPGVKVARELVDIPVVGPLEAAMNHASYFGHRFTVLTDHRKAVPWLEDLVRLHGAANCRGVRCIDWYVTDMIRDPSAVADDAAAPLDARPSTRTAPRSSSSAARSSPAASSARS